MDTTALQKFFARVRAGMAAGSKDVRLTMTEANELCAAIGEVVALRLAQATVPSPVTSVTTDGGSLKA